MKKWIWKRLKLICSRSLSKSTSNKQIVKSQTTKCNTDFYVILCRKSVHKLKEANLQFLDRVKQLQQVVNTKITLIQKAEVSQEESQ